MPCLETEIVKRSAQAKAFVQLPKRWIVERDMLFADVFLDPDNTPRAPFATLSVGCCVATPARSRD